MKKDTDFTDKVKSLRTELRLAGWKVKRDVIYCTFDELIFLTDFNPIIRKYFKFQLKFDFDAKK